jgi:hypothetical protein
VKTLLRTVCCLLLTIQANSVSATSLLQTSGNPQQESKLQPAPQGPTLEDGTPVKLRTSQTVSSADAHVNDRVEFEVLEDVKVADTLIIPKGGIAWGTVTEAQPKRRMARGGKLEIVMDSVRLADGERAALRATKEAQGGGHVGAMTAGIVATGLLFFPAAPFFLFMHGKDITIPKGTEVPTFVSGNFQLDLAKFRQSTPATAQPEAASVPSSPSTQTQADPNAQVEITSTPAGAEIEVDGAFVGSTPSTIGVSTGDHSIVVKKSGFKVWERKIKVTSGKIGISAELEADVKTGENVH